MSSAVCYRVSDTIFPIAYSPFKRLHIVDGRLSTFNIPVKIWQLLTKGVHYATYGVNRINLCHYGLITWKHFPHCFLCEGNSPVTSGFLSLTLQPILYFRNILRKYSVSSWYIVQESWNVFQNVSLNQFVFLTIGLKLKVDCASN